MPFRPVAQTPCRDPRREKLSVTITPFRRWRNGGHTCKKWNRSSTGLQGFSPLHLFCRLLHSLCGKHIGVWSFPGISHPFSCPRAFAPAVSSPYSVLALHLHVLQEGVGCFLSLRSQLKHCFLERHFQGHPSKVVLPPAPSSMSSCSMITS